MDLPFCQQNMVYAEMERILKNNLDHSKPPLTNEIIYYFSKASREENYEHLPSVEFFYTYPKFLQLLSGYDSFILKHS